MNKIATLRNSRGGHVPDLVQCCKDLVAMGAEGITIHPRPDARHIRPQDVYEISAALKKINRSQKSAAKKIEFNIEGYPNEDFFKYLKETGADQATLVPDPPEVLTSNAGWALAQNESELQDVLNRIQKIGARSSLFIDVFQFDKNEEAALARLKPDRIELYTERFAREFSESARTKKTCAREYARVAAVAEKLGIEVNAGHDLTSDNVGFLLKHVPQVIEVSIGHALISEALYLGFKATLQKYKKAMRTARV